MSNSLIQSKIVAVGTGTTTATATGDGYATTTTAGSLLILVVWGQDSSSNVGLPPTIQAPVTAGFTWILAASGSYGDSTNHLGGKASIFYILSASAMASSLSTSVTATASGTSPSLTVEFACWEISGPTTLDQTNTLSSQTTSPTNAGSLVDAGTDFVIVAAAGEGSTTATAGAGYTLSISPASATPGRSQYQLNASSGTLATGFTGTVGNPWGCAAASFSGGSVTFHPHCFGDIIGA